MRGFKKLLAIRSLLEGLMEANIENKNMALGRGGGEKVESYYRGRIDAFSHCHGLVELAIKTIVEES